MTEPTEMPDRIWVTRYLDEEGGHSNLWLPMQRIPDSERDTRPIESVQFIRTDHVITTLRQLGERFQLTNDLVGALVEGVKGESL